MINPDEAVEYLRDYRLRMDENVKDDIARLIEYQEQTIERLQGRLVGERATIHGLLRRG